MATGPARSILGYVAPVMAAALLMAGCASTGRQVAVRTASPKPPAATGPAAYLQAVRSAGLGNLDVTGAPDRRLIVIGQTICDGMDRSLNYADSVNALMAGLKSITTRQASTLVGAAVRDLCPENSAQLPTGT